MTAIIDYDTVELKKNADNIFTLVREREPKEIVLMRNENIDTVVMKSRLSLAYYFSIYTVVGVLIDGSTPKKWTYPKSVWLTDSWIEENNINNQGFHNKYAYKGAWNMRLSFPYLNWFYSAYENESKSRSGFMGNSIGLDYHYNDKMYLNITGSGILNFFIPVPAAVDLAGVWDHMGSLYATLSNNHMLNNGRLSLGYGVSYGQDYWNTVNHGNWGRMEDATKKEINQKSVYRNSNSLGLVFPFYYYTKHSFYMGIVYRPMLLQFNQGTRFQYQHTASFDFGWRIRLKK